jgi:hypothetical protein
MHPYIPHLLSDIQSAYHFTTPIQIPLTFEEEMEEVEKWAEGRDIPNKLSIACGLSPELFPPPEQLTEEDMRIVIQAMEEMLESWHRKVYLPDNVPIPMAYNLIIGLLEEEAWYMPAGYLCHDFCSGYAPECQLKEYCPCLKHWGKT